MSLVQTREHTRCGFSRRLSPFCILEFPLFLLNSNVKIFFFAFLPAKPYHLLDKKLLSYKGRLQLNKSFFLMQVYLGSIFVLLTEIINHFEQLMRNFLWSGRPNISLKAKMHQDNVCRPLPKEVLGIPSLNSWSIAAQLKHIWNFSKQ